MRMLLSLNAFGKRRGITKFNLLWPTRPYAVYPLPINSLTLSYAPSPSTRSSCASNMLGGHLPQDLCTCHSLLSGVLFPPNICVPYSLPCLSSLLLQQLSLMSLFTVVTFMPFYPTFGYAWYSSIALSTIGFAYCLPLPREYKHKGGKDFSVCLFVFPLL